MLVSEIPASGLQMHRHRVVQAVADFLFPEGLKNTLAMTNAHSINVPSVNSSLPLDRKGDFLDSRKPTPVAKRMVAA